MSYEFRNQTTLISRIYSKQFWAKALELAKLYGWEPMGTRLACQDVGWLGTYLTNDGQTVIAGDAYMLALAIEKSLDHISDANREIDWNPKLWIEDDLPEWLSPEERIMIEENLQDELLDVIAVDPLGYFAGDEKYRLAQLIRFCRLGSFVIL